MRDSTPSLYAYSITSICVIIFYILKWEDFITVVKPVIVPAIYYYYLQTTQRRINVTFTIAVWLFFVADMIEIIDLAAGIYWIMACNLASYIIMIRFALLDNIKIVLSWKSIIITVIAISTVAIFSNQIINQTHTHNTVYFYFFVLYTLTVLSMFGYAILRIFSKNDIASRLFFCMAVVMLLSDIIYASNKYNTYFMPLAIISFVAQFISYYFMVEYFNNRRSALNNIKI